MPARNLYLIIPVLNEAANIGHLLSELGQWAARLGTAAGCGGLTVILVDDGSSDGTADVAARSLAEQGASRPFDLVVLRHATNLGPGGAFATAFKELAGRVVDTDRIITMEGDNTSRLATAERLLVRQREGYDMVLASPYAYGGGFRQTSLLRLVLSHVANGSLKSILGIQGFHTMSSFFRVYTGELIRRLQVPFGPGIVERAGFECMVELLIKAVLLKASISEVEMLLDTSLRVGKSKMKIARTIRGYFSLLRLRYKWSRQLGAEPWSYVVHSR
jgi:dolichol-phosphate mannosyltransferase